jgi:hypothetical protein
MVGSLQVLRTRLQEACELRSSSFLELCHAMHIAPDNAFRLALNPEKLSVKQLFDFATKLDVSLDWLVGRNDDPDSHKLAHEMPAHIELPD